MAIIPIENITYAKTADELSFDERTTIATALKLNPLTNTITATSTTTTLSFTLGTPFLVFVDGQKIDAWNNSTDWDVATETINSIPHESGAVIEIVYIEKY